jgi:hypothetical protein
VTAQKPKESASRLNLEQYGPRSDWRSCLVVFLVVADSKLEHLHLLRDRTYYDILRLVKKCCLSWCMSSLREQESVLMTAYPKRHR